MTKFSGAEVKDQKGQKVEIGPATIDPGDKKQLIVALPKPLAGAGEDAVGIGAISI